MERAAATPETASRTNRDSSSRETVPSSAVSNPALLNQTALANESQRRSQPGTMSHLPSPGSWTRARR